MSIPNRRTFIRQGAMGAAGLMALGAPGLLSARLRGTSLTDLPLLQETDLTLSGYFTLTTGEFSYGGHGMGYSPTGNSGAGSLLLGGKDPAITGKVSIGEIVIPVLSGAATTLTAPTVIPNVGNLNRLGGLLVQNGELIASGYIYYDTGGSATTSHWRSTDLAVGNLSAPVRAGTLNPGFVGGYMGHIPSEWQSALGGPCFTGQCNIPIIGRTSWGPAMFAFNPADLGVSNPAPVTPLLYYTSSNPLRNPSSTNAIWGHTSKFAGAFFVPGTRSVCFVGRHGIGEICYGTGQATNPLQNCEEVSPGHRQTYDPYDQYQGYHAFPYVHHLLAYDALDLQEVKDGLANPWDPEPYAVWELPGMATSPGFATVPGGCLAYDPLGRRVFVGRGSGTTLGSSPRIYVWEHVAF